MTPNPDLYRPGTFREWRAVLRREMRSESVAGLLRLGLTLLRAALRIGGVSKEEWRRRMSVCEKCPIFDPALFRCRPYDGAPWGCGCYVPFMALVNQPYALPGCWGDVQVPGQKIGWEANRTPVRDYVAPRTPWNRE